MWYGVSTRGERGHAVAARAADRPNPVKISVITPCFDAQAGIRPTLASILGQRAALQGRVALELIVCDGGSTDGTQAIVREVCGDAAILVSEPDRGMYDALAKGLARATGEVCTYLNAGDLLDPGAFDVVADVMQDGRISWVTGINLKYNDRLQLIQASLPFRYQRDLIAKGLYGPVLPFVQQEGTFWRRDLIDHVDLHVLATLDLAGDYYLWRSFAAVAELVVVESALGGFVFHEGQRSEDLRGYLAEMEKVRDRPGIIDLLRAWVDLKLWDVLPPNWKKRLNPSLLRYDRRRRRWE
jgi:glycosyltransferase involved in cell wall biosynthesis